MTKFRRPLFIAGSIFIMMGSGFSQSILINECLPENTETLIDFDGDTPDWIELYNSGSQTVNLAGFSLSDTFTMPAKWVLPSVTLPPGGFLLIFASGKNLFDVPLYWNTVIDRGDLWKYILPQIEPPSTWKDIGFIDTAWNSGVTGIGYGDDDDSTIVENTLAVFLRKEFEISGIQNIQKAVLHIDYDDGFIAYLNGHEIARNNLGTPGTAVPFDRPADNGSHEALIFRGLKPEAYVTDSVFSFLQEGTNVLAIQVHNGGITSSDLSAIPVFTLGLNSAPDSAYKTSVYFETSQQGLHTNFKIDASGETIYLYDTSGSCIDSLYLHDNKPDISIGRKPDGSAIVQYFNLPTPGSKNTSTGYLPFSGFIPTFSHHSGFYSSAFDLELDAGSDTIYYTLDGSEPGYGSSVYQQSIHIEDNAVVRARVMKQNQLPGETKTNSYIFRTDFDMPVISITTAPANLWDIDSGIYVLGRNAEPNEPHYGANFWMDWEIPVHIEFFEPEGNRGFDIDAGIKITGKYSRASNQKSLAVFARNKYGVNRINYDIFGYIPVESFKSFVLRNSGNDFLNTTFRDAFQTSLVSSLGIDVQAFRPAVVYLNGEYWGIQNLREKISEHYIQSHYNIIPDSLDMLENYASVIHGSEEQYNAMLSFIAGNSLSIAANYEFVGKQMDIENYMNYLIAQIYIDNTDWPGNNLKYWRKRSADGRWRWIMYDTDFGFGIWDVNNYSKNTLSFALEPNNTAWPNPSWSTFLFRKLLENNEFKTGFINRFADNLNTLFLPGYVSEYITHIQNRYLNEMPMHLQRWSGNYSSWINQVNNMKTFAQYRPENIREFIQLQFGLNGTHTIALNVSGNRGGTIRLNSIRPQTYPWSGLYFSAIPVTLTAIPEPGYRFIKWEGASGSESATIELNLLSNISLTALFEPDGSRLNYIAINEINYNSSPTGNAGDWIELVNNGPEQMDLSFWQIRDSKDEHVFVLPYRTILLPGAYLAVCRDSVLFESQYAGVTNYVGNLSFGLAKSGDCIRLFNYRGELADSVWYMPVWPWVESPNGRGHSLALINPSLNNNYFGNWSASIGTGTPGEANDILQAIPQTGGKLVDRGDALFSCYPNPFGNELNIVFQIRRPGTIRISMINSSGMVCSYYTETFSQPGMKEVHWDLTKNRPDIPKGIYVVRIETSSTVITTRVIRLGD